MSETKPFESSEENSVFFEGHVLAMCEGQSFNPFEARNCLATPVDLVRSHCLCQLH